MKKLFFAMCVAFCAQSAFAYRLVSSRELGRDDAKNQNVTVRCTTDAGKISNQTCQLRRFASCKTAKNGKKTCSGWQPWQDVRNPGKGHSDWRSAADTCCRAKGLR